MGLLSALFGGQKQASKYQATIQPNINIAKDLSLWGSTKGKETLDKGMMGIDELTKYWGDILHGSPDHLLQSVDASSITAGMDQALDNTIQNAPRGGIRAGTVANLQFDKAAAINKAITSIRGLAPDHLQALAQYTASLGGNLVQFGADQNEAVTNMLNFVEQVRQAEAQRKAGIFGSIMAAVGGVLGGGLAGGAIKIPGLGGSGQTPNIPRPAPPPNSYFINGMAGPG